MMQIAKKMERDLYGYCSMDCVTPKLPFLTFFSVSFLLFSVSFSDPRISESGLFCGNSTRRAAASFITEFVKEMENLSQTINTHHFATHQIVTGYTTQMIYGLAQCHRDLSQTDCLLCYAASRTRLPRCLPSLSARIFLDGCFLRYDTYNFYNESISPYTDTFNCSNDKAPMLDDDTSSNFVRSVGYALGHVTDAAVRSGSGFGVAGVQGVYALAQCWDSLGSVGCKACLEKAAKAVKSCAPSSEGRGMNAGCYLRYSTRKFYSNGREEEERHGWHWKGFIMAIALASAAFLILSLFTAYAVYSKLSKLNQERNNLGPSSRSFHKSNLKFKYETLEKATDYFSPLRKIGQGGAGSVFMGILPNDETVAVKRLIFNTRQWVDEFFNEVNLISGIQHKNLVKLLGCSIEGPESLLVYEYVPNKSLDQFIFDETRMKLLSWKLRINIILDTAEGLAYLHEGSETRIIHRDIKSSNILLDADFRPKIADFGLARQFGADKTHLSTVVAGTLGYMAPEYLIRGQLTEKADIYSFGVLVLEIVCGRRNNAFKQDSGTLLQTVWKLHRSNRLAEAVDPCLQVEFSVEEACKVLRIGLLCAQATAALRPSMTQVILMLTDKDCEIPMPNQPPFLNSSLLEPPASVTACSENSLTSNAATKIAVSYTSTESSSTPSSHGE